MFELWFSGEYAIFRGECAVFHRLFAAGLLSTSFLSCDLNIKNTNHYFFIRITYFSYEMKEEESIL